MSEFLERHRRVRALFEHVRDLPYAERAAAMADAGEHDSSVPRKVADLLAADRAAGSFLEQGAAASLQHAGDLAGLRLGPYEIGAPIGAGAMGLVFRARDVNLHRDVALKILPELFASDPGRRARFHREAQALAALNHPNIAAIHGFEESGSTLALALELVEGHTLAERIAAAPVALEEGVQIARQIADALTAAHDNGIVHRDLKPANIKVRRDGTVKVLDFGLAKAVEPLVADAGGVVPSLPANPAATGAGMVLGSAAYMSPEQARGESVDRRSDIWAFGCVLFELLSGSRAFDAASATDTLALVQASEPDFSRLPPEMPPSLSRLLRRCLEKDRRRRLADISDARFDLDEAVLPLPTLAAPRRRRSSWRPWALAAMGFVSAVAFAASLMLERPAGAPQVYRSTILLPAPLDRVLGASIALSPDGRRLAFVARDETGRTRLWVRALDGVTAKLIPDTTDASTPFWSPDSEWLAYVQNGRLKKIAVAGGEPIAICDDARYGGAWSRDGVILFTHRTRNLAQVPASGGRSSPLTVVDADAPDPVHLFPSFLPDGRQFVYVRRSSSERAGVYLGSLDSTVHAELPLAASNVQYAGGLLWFVRGRTLMVHPFDVRGRTLVGREVAVAEPVREDATFLRSAFFSVSAAGALVFQTTAVEPELEWYDRKGRAMGTLGAPGDYADIQLSPDGRRALISIARGGTRERDLWILDVARGSRTRITFDETRLRHGAIWSPDGRDIVFTSERQGRVALVRKASDGSGTEEVLLEDELDKELASWSPDGRFILYNVRRGASPPLAWVLPLDGERKPVPFSQPRAFFPQFSPDGRWVAYMSSESGRNEVYATRFPGPGPKVAISAAGAIDPAWRGDGKELFFLSAGRLMSASIALDRERIEVGETRPLFALPKVGPRKAHDVSRDGQRIIAVRERPEAASSPLTLVVNWPALVKN